MNNLKQELVNHLLSLSKDTYTIRDFFDKYNNDDHDFLFAFNGLVDEGIFISNHGRNLKVMFSADGVPGITAHEFIIT